jgi:hypothetical protein
VAHGGAALVSRCHVRRSPEQGVHNPHDLPLAVNEADRVGGYRSFRLLRSSRVHERARIPRPALILAYMATGERSAREQPSSTWEARQKYIKNGRWIAPAPVHFELASNVESSRRLPRERFGAAGSAPSCPWCPCRLRCATRSACRSWPTGRGSSSRPRTVDTAVHAARVEAERIRHRSVVHSFVSGFSARIASELEPLAIGMFLPRPRMPC